MMKGFSSILILFFAAVSFVHGGGSNGAPPPEEDCPGPNEVFNPCGGCFVEICNVSQPEGVACAAVCTPRCECRTGFIRASANGPCISENECKPHPNCGNNEEYMTCGASCEPTCDDHQPATCIRHVDSCVDGCFCKEDFIRESEGGPCIPYNQCKPDPRCGDNEEYKSCGTGCLPTCDLGPEFGCGGGGPCIEGCFCKKNFIREFHDGRCIPEDKCKPIPKCGKNEEYMSCGTLCPQICGEAKPENCTFKCGHGCYCKKDFIRKSANGPCIPENECKPKPNCGKNEEWDDCGTACEPTCDDREPGCTDQCVEGCFCKKDFIRKSTNGPCISEGKCPITCTTNTPPPS